MMFEWSVWRVMKPTDHLYGVRCGCISSDRRSPCRNTAKYVSTLGNCAVVNCEECFQRKMRAGTEVMRHG